MKSFSFLNRKGGTGKTSISVTCAIELARQGHKTVLIDCDPQGNSSSWLARNFKYELADVLTGKVSVQEAIVPSIMENLSIIPTFAINGSLQSFAAGTRNYYVFIDSVFPSLSEFEYVVFDTSPAFGDFEKSIANSADVIVPVLKLDQFSADGFQTLIENLDTTTKEIRCHDLLDKISFVILNQQDKRMKFQSLFAENFMKNFDDTQFLTIPTDTAFVKAQILKRCIQDKSITARKETLDSISKIAGEMTK
ncbi:MAG: ParA family protein [Treponema sp.]|nr:ParA family protein [Spirochaetia bacterium]MDD7014770.1 ParA family protein [Spirochaetales bacterium]MDY4902646.1 ParA family protein [Treponema sp.]